MKNIETNLNNKDKELSLINTYRSALMGFAAIMVLIHHEWLPIAPEGTIAYEIGFFIRYSGFLGVDIFLLLSGMGMYYAIQKYDIKTFYKRRILRILPSFIIVSVIIALVDDWSIEKFIKNITGYNFYVKSTFSFLWYAIAIIQFYLVFPLYYKFFNKSNNKKKFTVLAILMWLLCMILFSNSERSDMFVFTNRIPIFLIGILFGWLERNEKVELNKYHQVICIIILIIGLSLEYFIIEIGLWKTLNMYGTSIPAVLVCIPMVLLIPQLFELINTHLRKFGQSILKLFSLVGGVSFELYCVQEWIGDKIQLAMKDNYNNLLINIVDWLVVAVACIVLSCICRIGGKIKNYVKTLE